ncbi:MAG: TatD family hydrolase [Caldilineaceae bacterium]|nr:TatD family hydrolase [Caldilineaceae bacterium]
METRGLGPLLVDSHCHLDLNQFDEDRDAVVERARQQGVRLIVNPGIDLNHCRHALTLADRYPEVYAAVGFHPNSSDQYDPSKLADLRQLATHPKVVAIGEIGLDYYWKKVEPAQQAIAFRDQLDLAADLGLPVIIHSRDASGDVAATLEGWVERGGFSTSALARRSFAGVLHAYGGDLALAQRAYDWNFVLSLGGPVTYKNARSLHALVPQLRLDRLMLETDAPYLTPHPHRGERNEPGYVALVAAQMAALYGRSLAEIAAETSRVAFRFFGVEERSVISGCN